MTACVQANDFAACRKLFREALEKGIPLTVIGYNIVVSAAAKQGDWQTAMAVVKQMQAPNSTTPVPDAVTYGTLLAACEAAGQWHQVLEQAQAMKNEGFDLDVRALSSCLHACQQLGRAEQALQLLEQMEALPAIDTQVPDAVAYRLALSACARGGKLTGGLRLLEKLETQFPHEEANVVAYTAAIAGCEVEGQWKVAFRLVDRMRKRGVQPNEMTFVAVLAACATACARQAASKSSADASAHKDMTSFEPYQQAMKLLRVMNKDPTVVNPNIHVYNAALRVCAEACDLTGAFALYNELLEDRDSSGNVPEGTVALKPNIVTFGTLMTACERVGSMEGVTQVFRWMQEFSDPPLKPNEIVYGAALSACRRAQNDERSFFLFEQMLQNPKLRPNVATYNTVLLAQTEANTKTSMTRGLSVFRSLYNSPYTQPNRQSYQIMIRALALDRRPLEAMTLLQQMQQAGLRPEVDLYTCTVTAFEKTGQHAQALKLMEAMRADGYDFYSNGVLDAAFKQGVQIVSSVQRGLETKKLPKSLDAGLAAPRSFNETIAQWIAPSME
jgi:pentatricopeptide repeat domain-containing protein 1